MDLTSLTLEQLASARPDLVEAIEQKSRGELDQLRSKLAEYEAKEARARLEAEIRAEIEAAGLDPQNKLHVSGVFLEQLIAASDGKVRQAMIEDRKALVAAAATEGRKKEAPRTTVSGSPATTDDPNYWLKRLTSPSRLTA